MTERYDAEARAIFANVATIDAVAAALEAAHAKGEQRGLQRAEEVARAESASHERHITEAGYAGDHGAEVVAYGRMRIATRIADAIRALKGQGT